MIIFLFKFEERKYQGGQNWVSHKKNFKINTEKKAQNDMFMSLFNYITGKNETGNQTLYSIGIRCGTAMMDYPDKKIDKKVYIYNKNPETCQKPAGNRLEVSGGFPMFPEVSRGFWMFPEVSG